MNQHFTPVFSGARLSDQVAEQLSAEIKQGRLAPGDKLPTEARLVEQFQVSRTVVREAVSRLKSLGLLESRQGSGVFVSAQLPFAPLQFEARLAASQEAVVQMVELRRALEAEVAALAAERRRASDLRAMAHAVQALDRAVQAGGDGVAEDVKFHSAIARAARNPFLIQTLDYLSQFMHGATRVTRANEARRGDFVEQVRAEHQAILLAVQAGMPEQARQAAAAHMGNAICRIQSADPAFWLQEGERLAQALVKGLRR
ncbi:FadR/GntR family transcriptional regulator [Limnohabitans sp.]|jgi:GntR family transcriptional repressor for pyruvate dehydrogenase complex|uniref:FadR/GntR family transcriptional regulator n=1 Tax=Limnohabitans sp. TaxID=1907725 RepID=UPI0037C0BF44